MTDDGGRGAEILPMHVGRELRQAGLEDSHAIPEFDVPHGFKWNPPVCDPDRTIVGLRAHDASWFLEVHAVEPLATIDGPYYAELLRHIGGPKSFQTRLVHRWTGIEPGAMQVAVDCLAKLRDGYDG